VLQKDNEIDQLKNALSESQLGIFEERKHVLRLISENDELKGSYILTMYGNAYLY
jgi:hypothetical protein